MKKIAIATICASMFMMTGCVNVTKSYSDEGKEAYAISSTWQNVTPADLYAKAGKICGSRGYVIHMESSQAIGSSTNGGTLTDYIDDFSKAFASNSNPSNANSMLITCKW